MSTEDKTNTTSATSGWIDNASDPSRDELVLSHRSCDEVTPMERITSTEMADTYRCLLCGYTVTLAKKP